MAEHSPKGLPTHFGDELLEAFPSETRKTLGTALAELEADGLVTLSHVLGPHLPRVRTTVELFIASDPAITGHDPVEVSARCHSSSLGTTSLARHGDGLRSLPTHWPPLLPTSRAPTVV